MRKAILYLLLFAYTTIVCKPIFPSIADTVAHIFWYSEHMATVHVENGKYHVHLEYTNAARKNYPEKDANLPKAGSDTDHLITAVTYHFSLPPVIETHFLTYTSPLSGNYLHSDFPPPRA